MTDSAAARAYPDGPDEPDSPPRTSSGGDASAPAVVADAFAPAAHSHATGADASPAVSSSRIAVLDSQPLLGFPGEASVVRMALGSERAPAPEPPAFGFNAPAPAEGGAPVAPDSEVPTAGRPPSPAVGAEAPPAPAWSSRMGAAAAMPAPTSIPRRALPPRELMPPTSPLSRHRLGEAPTPTFGPPGKQRSTAAIVLLSVLTLGWYAVAWHRRVNQEMGDFDPRVHVHPARSAWAVALPLLAGILATAAAAARILLAHAGVSLDVPVTVAQAYVILAAIGAVPYLVMMLPFSLVAVTMTAERVRVVEDHAGLSTDEQIRPAALVGWLAVPVLGGFVVMARQQRSLNRIWRLARA